MTDTKLQLGVGMVLPNDQPPFEETADWLVEHGFSGIMLSLNPQWDDVLIEKIGHVLAARDLAVFEVAAYTSLIHQDAAVRRQNIDAVKRRVEQAVLVNALCVATVGGSAIGWAPHPQTHSDESWSLLLDATWEILEVTPPSVRFCLESWPPTVLPDLTALERVVNDIGDDRLGILYDPANLVTLDGYFSSGAMIKDSFRRLGHRFVATHCKDVSWLMGGMQTGVAEVVPGRGVLDYKALLKCTASSEQELPLIIEHLKDPQDVLEAAAFIRMEAQELGLAID